jgi:L-glyceraldehyde 3-phosphate reductase
MAIAWVLRDPRMTSALIGASRVEQIEDAVSALDNLAFSKAELAEIDKRTEDAGINLWKRSSTA